MLIIWFRFFYLSQDFAIRKQLLESSMKSYAVTMVLQARTSLVPTICGEGFLLVVLKALCSILGFRSPSHLYGSFFYVSESCYPVLLLYQEWGTTQ